MIEGVRKPFRCSCEFLQKMFLVLVKSVGFFVPKTCFVMMLLICNDVIMYSRQ